MSTFVFAHDLNGSPSDPFAQALRRKGVTVRVPDGRFRTLARRVQDLTAELSGLEGAILIGQGTGAPAAWVAAAAAAPGEVAALVLLSPALGWSEPPTWDPPATALPGVPRVLLIHAEDDLVTPLHLVDDLVRREPRIERAVVSGPRDAQLRDILFRIRKLRARRSADASARPPAAPRPPKAAPRPRRKPILPPLAPRKPPVERRKAAPKPRAPKARKAAARYRRWPLVFAHDLDGRASDPPVTLLHRWSPEVPDGFGRTPERRIEDLLAAVRDAGPCVVVGHGLGATLALAAAGRAPDLVRGVLLLGPCLADAPAATLPARTPAALVHGASDLVADVQDSRRFVERHPHASLVVVEDVHDLRASGPAVIGALQDLQARLRS